MTLHHTLLSEWTKLRTTASFWWTTGLILALSIGWAALTTWSVRILSGDLGAPVYGAEWGLGGSMLIFVAWSAAVWLLGVLAVRARDA